MTYPPSNPGYPAAQQYGQPQQQAARAATTTPADTDSGLSAYLLIGVIATGLIAYVLSFVGLSTISIGNATILSFGMPEVGLTSALLAAVLAAVSLLPKQKSVTGVVAAVSVLGLLLLVYAVIAGFDSVGWALWAVAALILVQAVCAVAALLFETGVMTSPAPRPQFDPQAPQYGQYGGPSQYYGQQTQPQHGGPSYQQQRPGYPSQYGSYPSGGSTGGFTSQASQAAPQSGPPTPPTGFPTFGQPQHQASSANADDQTSVVPTQQPPQDPPSQSAGQNQS